MPVNTRSRDRLSVSRESMEPETTGVDPSHSGLSTVEESALSSRNLVASIPDIGNEPISNIRDDTRESAVPPLTLPHQHMGDPELRKLIGQLSDTQSSMMEILQSMIEPHSGENLNSLHGSGAVDPNRAMEQDIDEENDPVILGYRFNPQKRMTAAEVRKFDGNGKETGRNWLKNFEHHARTYNWNQDYQVRGLINALEGKALLWYESLPENQRYQLGFLKYEIGRIFNEANAQTEAMEKLSTISMKPNQDITEFWYQVVTECQKVDPETKDATKINWFLRGLPPKIRAAVHRVCPKLTDPHQVIAAAKGETKAQKIEEAIASKKRKEKTPVELIIEESQDARNLISEEDRVNVIQNDRKKPRRDPQPAREDLPKLQKDLEDIKKALQRMEKERSYLAPKKQSSPRPYLKISYADKIKAFREDLCLNCMKKGHIARNCPKRREENLPSKRELASYELPKKD